MEEHHIQQVMRRYYNQLHQQDGQRVELLVKIMVIASTHSGSKTAIGLEFFVSTSEQWQEDRTLLILRRHMSIDRFVDLIQLQFNMM